MTNPPSATSTTAKVLGIWFARSGGVSTSTSGAEASSAGTVAGTGYGSLSGGGATAGSGSGRHAPFTPTIVPFRGGASSEKVRLTILAVMSGIMAVMTS